MEFETFINKPTAEMDLIHQIVSEIQKNFDAYQDSCYFLKLEQCGNSQSKIVWIKKFPDILTSRAFYFDSVFQRACFHLQFKNGKFRLMCLSFNYCGDVDVEANDFKLYIRPTKSNLELLRMPSLDHMIELSEGFKEIAEAVKNSKNKIAE